MHEGEFTGDGSFSGLFRDPLVIIVTAVRIGAALSIFWYPLWGLIWSFIFDILDARILLHMVGFSREQYHMWDKNIDWTAYVIMLTVASSYGMFLPLFLLLFFRFMGQFMYLRTHNTWFFIFFPNLFEAGFLWMVIFYPIPGTVQIDTPVKFWWLVALFAVKESQEVLLHFIWPRYLLAPWQRLVRPIKFLT